VRLSPSASRAEVTVLACSPAGRPTFVASWRTWDARACWTTRSARRSCSRTRAPCRPRQRSSAVAHPAVERTMHDGDAPLKTACGTEPRQRRAPHPGGVQSSCCVAMSRRAARAPLPAAARRPEGPGSTRGQVGKNNCHKRSEKQNVRVLTSEDVAQRAFWESTSQLKKRD
jgi:hypothetical protein